MSSDESVYKGVFMEPIDQAFERARTLASFLSAGKRDEFLAQLGRAQAQVRLLVDREVAIELQGSSNPAVERLQRELAERDALLREYGAKIAAANRAQNSENAKLQRRVEELERQVVGRTPKQAALDKATGRLRLARELVADLRAVVVPMAQRLEEVNRLGLKLAEATSGSLGPSDIDKLLDVSRLLVNEADKTRPEEYRERDADELDTLVASRADEVTGVARRSFTVARVGRHIGKR